ncbi:MAG: hypothetical protein CO125_06140 [Hydrogenophilales bacterium CG_4_9_14_3_um_filter_59_35]|nr:MAG: hypothetical protein COW70_10610 [Hydrogenophilales bacterium CG18_big_fil_WC_8_21_14_2_50_58_12]PIY01538.1 MAG: hypothetical protein COZ23_02675 [Hydrogenophilales bacterium CG_4_10_14_3_um_filter_58_23]PJB06893.1 MAG: hypothetical protein CO125_06140 [Hydrogenophilales bacterium CG_4_9_14_3_um_filter_59_35]
MAGLQQVSGDRLSELIPTRDYSNLNRQDCQLRVWLPDPVKRSLEEICEINETSMTAYLTEYFATYLFGHHELLRMRAKGIGLYELKPLTRYNMESVAVPTEPDLGKNIFALKIWVPDKIKDGLRSLAERAGVTLGEFSRALICAHLFGYEYGKSKLMNITMLNENVAQEWENALIDNEAF